MISVEKNDAIERAKIAAEDYCIKNNLSLDKLSTQWPVFFGEVVGFMQKMPYHGTGLLEDIASQPKPTLTFYVDTGEIETTEYTMQYLS